MAGAGAAGGSAGSTVIGGDMSEYDFAKRAKSFFSYLIEEYGFSVATEMYDAEAFGNSLVEFRSDAVELRVVLDRGQVLIDMGPYPEVPGFRFGLPLVVDFLAPGALNSVYVFPEEWNDYYGMIDWQLDRLAQVLRQCCGSVLSGEFSQWKEMYESARTQAEDTYRATTGKNPIRIVSKEIQEQLLREVDRRRDKA
jgi:hypothetical protein